MTIRVVPIRFAPVPGEAFDSWIDAYADRCAASPADMLAAVGLRSPRGTQPWANQTPDFTIRMTRDELAFVTAATGVAAGTLTAMTLTVWDGRAVHLRADRRVVDRLRLWGRGRGSRACPHCLRENGGRWPLEWRLTWTFACLTHRCLLIDRCPDCRTDFRRQGVSMYPHPLATCRASLSAGTKQTCRADLTTAPTLHLPDQHPVLLAQEWINELLHGRTPNEDVTAVLGDVRTLGGRLLAIGTPDLVADLGAPFTDAVPQGAADNEPGRTRSVYRPRTVISAAAAITWATKIIAAPDRDNAVDRLRPLIELSRDRGGVVSPALLTKLWGGTSPTLQAVMWRAVDKGMPTMDRLRWGSTTPTPRTPTGNTTVTTRVRYVPQMFWPHLAIPLMPPTGIVGQGYRRALSIAVLIPGDTCRTLRAYAARLDHRDSRFVSQLLGAIPDERDLRSNVLTAVHRIATYLDENETPICYTTRRSRDYTDLLPRPVWNDMCLQVAVIPGTASRHRHARRYLYHRITGAYLDTAPADLRLSSSSVRSSHATFTITLTPDLHAALDEYATAYLADHHIDGPLTWEPPASLLTGLTLPGRSADDINVHRVHTLTTNGVSAIDIARTLETSIDHVRLTLADHPCPPSETLTTGRTPNWKRHQEAHSTVTPDYLTEQLNAGKTFTQIAHDTGYARGTITNLARGHHIPVPACGRKAQPVDPDWLRHQYVDLRRTTRQIANDIGMSPANIVRKLSELGIPARPRGGASHQAALTVERTRRGYPAILRAALTSETAWQRLERFAAVAQYRTITEAARALSIQQPILTSHIHRLETDTQQILLNRAERGRPMTLTRAGRRLLTAIHANRPDMDVPAK